MRTKWTSTSVQFSLPAYLIVHGEKNQIIFYHYKKYKMLGIGSTQPDQSLSFNHRIRCVSLAMALLLIGTFVFFLFEANSATEYGIAFSNLLFELTSTIFYIENMIRMSDISKLIGNCENFIEMSERLIILRTFVILDLNFPNRTASFG